MGTAFFSPSAVALEGLTAVGEETLPEEGKPDLAFPHGFFSFNIVGLTPCAGEAVTVTIELPSAVPVGTQYWKCQDDNWYQIPIDDDDGDNVITIQLTDGGTGDADGDCNGVIVDPGGSGVPPPPPPPVGAKAYPVNKLAILVPWIALGMAIIAGAAVALRRRRAQG